MQACLLPGISMAAVALSNGLNATMLRKWVMEAERVQRLNALPPPAEGAPNVVTPRGEGFVALQLGRH